MKAKRQNRRSSALATMLDGTGGGARHSHDRRSLFGASPNHGRIAIFGAPVTQAILSVPALAANQNVIIAGAGGSTSASGGDSICDREAGRLHRMASECVEDILAMENRTDPSSAATERPSENWYS